MPDLRVKVLLEGDQFKAEQGKIGSAVDQISAKVETRFDSMIASVAGFSFAFNQIDQIASRVSNAIKVPLETFQKFETALTDVESLGVKNIEALEDGVLAAASEISIPIDNIAAGLYDVVSAGVDASNQIEVLEQSARGARAGIASTTETLEFGSAVIKGYGKEWSDFTSVLDQGLKTVELGQTTFGELSANAGKVIPVFAALKIETEELFGGFATLTGVTGNTAEVSTQLARIGTELARPTERLTQLVKEQAGTTVENLVAQEGLAGILKIVQAETEGSASKMNELFSSSEAVTAALALSGTQFDTFIEKSDAMRNASGSLNRAFEIQNDTIESSFQILENKFNVKLIETVELISPVIKSVIDFGASLLDVDYEPFIIGATTAAAALAGLGIGIQIAALGGLGTALSVAGAAFSGFAATATAAIASIPLVGWIAAGISALTALGIALVATADDETDLANERKRTAEETVNIIEAEKRRVEQAIKTQGATKNLTDQLENMNRHLINQQKIISDANITIFTEKLKEAAEEVNDIAQNFEFGVAEGFDDKVDLMRSLLVEFGEDFVALDEEVSQRAADVIDELRKNTAGAIELSDERQRELEEEKKTLLEIGSAISKAADAQRELNEERERFSRLGNMSIKVDIDEDAINDVVNEIRNRGASIPVRPTLDMDEDEFNIPIGFDQAELPEDLPFFDDDRFAENVQRDLEILDLKLDAQIISEQQYLDQRIALYSSAHEEVAGILGDEHIMTLRMQAERVQSEVAATKARVSLQQQASRQIVNGLNTILNGFQGVSRTIFNIAKAASIAQATMSTYTAANEALKQYGWPMGAVVAGIVTAAGLANVLKISQTKFQKKKAGGPISDENRTVREGDFGDGENRLIIANTDEYIIRGEQTIRNRAVLDMINNSDQQFQIVNGNKLITKDEFGRIPRRILGGLIAQSDLDSIARTNNDLAALVSFREQRPSISANQNLEAQFESFKTDVVNAIRNVNIQFTNLLDGQTFLRNNVPRFEKEESERKAF